MNTRSSQIDVPPPESSGRPNKGAGPQRAGVPLRPYYVSPGAPASKRILLISYHAPPSNEVGAIRWTGMARYFAERGWGIDMIAVDPDSLVSRNDALLAALPAGTRLFGAADTLPLLDRLVNLLVRARRWFRAAPRTAQSSGAALPAESEPVRRSPAQRVSLAFHAWREFATTGAWARRAATVGRTVFDPALHHWVIASGPPFMSLEGGRLLSRWTGLPFIADFRDAWRFQEWVPLGEAWRRRAVRQEALVVKQSTLTVVNVEPVRALMQAAYPAARIVKITNGVDEDVIPPSSRSSRFVIGYPGTIYLGRKPGPLMLALSEMIRELNLAPGDVSLEFMGFYDSAVEASLRESALAHGVSEFLRVHPGLPRPEALAFMGTCSILVGLQAGSDLAIPAKIFEFMRFPAWLLVLAGRNSATADLLEGTGAHVHEPSDVAGIRATLIGRYLEFQQGVRPTILGNEPRFSRRHQAGILLDEMASVAHPNGVT